MSKTDVDLKKMLRQLQFIKVQHATCCGLPAFIAGAGMLSFFQGISTRDEYFFKAAGVLAVFAVIGYGLFGCLIGGALEDNMKEKQKEINKIRDNINQKVR